MYHTTIAIIITAFLFIGLERINPGRHWKKVDGWWVRAIFLNACQILIVYIASLTWNIWLQKIPVFRIEAHFGLLASAFFGYFLITFVFYWWHRARHQVSFLWVRLHQIHHSAQKLETLTAFYKHPLEMIVNSIFMSFIMYSLLGLSPATASLTTLMTGLAELFYHWNITTPRWLGYFIQRPESHCIHHQLGWHTQNYSDLPLWDILFNTFKNPLKFNKSCGFKNDRETRLKEMLLGVDVNPPEK